ncbi:broad-complex core protein-like isoform X2 [Chrysoperla carnea]|uniref:broad-complex core protein-like isoform X2 n=1 Tax=Chrysoperla carnea TaxID=189513 RepID=UPI001D063C7B|nr:broad-complex core protein-like isoform X2 [Chrysoperla carnea]
MVRRKISKPREIISGKYLDEEYHTPSSSTNICGDLDFEKQDNMAIHALNEQHNYEQRVENTYNNQHYCLRWNNYQTNMTSVFHQLLQNEAFVDVTLACNDLSLKAHKVVLSACSTYFQKLLLENPCKHPTIIMPQDVCYTDLKFIIEFVYRGEIDVSQEELQSLLKTADQLKIKGLCEIPGTTDHTIIPTSINNNTIINDKYNQETSLHHSQQQNHRIELSPVPIVSRRAYSKLRRITTSTNKRLHTKYRLLSPKRSLKDITHITGDSPENCKIDLNTTQGETNSEQRFCDQSVDEDDKEHKMPAVLMVNDEKVTNGEGFGGTLDEESLPIKRETLDRITDNNGDHCDRDNLWSPAASSDSGGSNQPLNMTGHGLLTSQTLFPGHVELPPEPPAPSATPVPCPPQELIHNSHTVNLTHCSPTTHHDLSDTNMSVQDVGGMHCGSMSGYGEDVKVKFETLRSVDSAGDIDACSRMSQESSDSMRQHQSSMMITPQLLGLLPGSSGSGGNHPGGVGGGPKTWSQEDMELALDALRNHNMSLTKASATYGIPSTTLWQRAHRLGIDTPKKEGPTKSWTEDSLNSALEALRTGTISANKASKAYGIPSSTLYKIARREGIRLAAPFNAAPTTWSPDDLERALESIRSGQTSVQRASTEFGIPTGTLYGRCKREGIELSRSNPTPWSEDAMGEALEAVRVGQMSINQAAIHYNLPYSSLYGRFKRGKYDNDSPQMNSGMPQSLLDSNSHENTNSMHATDHQHQLMQQYATVSQQMNANQHSMVPENQQQQQQNQQQHTQHPQHPHSPQPQHQPPPQHQHPQQNQPQFVPHGSIS